MKSFCSLGLLCLIAWEAQADIVEFNLSPPGHGHTPGLSALNEIIPGESNGSGDEISGGIFFDTATLQLTLSIGYGSFAGFSDLTGAAFSWLLHGPAIESETAPALFDLAPFHAFAPNHNQGGTLVGALTLTPPQADDLLAGLDYINIYTPGNLGGEIRGQLAVVPEPALTWLALFGAAFVFAASHFRVRRSDARGTTRERFRAAGRTAA